MYFTDINFFIFLFVVVTLYWCLPFRWQNLLLLVASYIFYGFVYPWICLLMFAVSVVNFVFAILIEDYPKHKRASLIACLLLSLSGLMYFKYAMFFLANMKLLFPNLPWTLQVFLPAGISFYTFQGLAYTADVYLGKLKAERRLLNFLVFKAFFPQLVAGPIARITFCNKLIRPESSRVSGSFAVSNYWRLGT